MVVMNCLPRSGPDGSCPGFPSGKPPSGQHSPARFSPPQIAPAGHVRATLTDFSRPFPSVFLRFPRPSCFGHWHRAAWSVSRPDFLHVRLTTFHRRLIFQIKRKKGKKGKKGEKRGKKGKKGKKREKKGKKGKERWDFLRRPTDQKKGDPDVTRKSKSPPSPPSGRDPAGIPDDLSSGPAPPQGSQASVAFDPPGGGIPCGLPVKNSGLVCLTLRRS